MSNCIDCPHHEVIADPDPHDSFCMDDVAVVCRMTLNQARDTTSRHRSDRHPNRSVTWACRPYNTRKESETPDWCPLPKGG